MSQVAVLMPVYNAQSYVAEAVESLLAQTFTDFELWIVDDASTDDTPAVLKHVDDPRVHVVLTHENKGLAYRLNQLLTLTDAPLIARMDGDDIALPTRLERQVAFFETHPEVDVCGTDFEVFPAGGVVRMPVAHSAIVERHLFTTGVCHPSVMMRRSRLMDVGGYPNVPCAQDYALWVELAAVGARFANIPEVLLKYRVHGTSTTTRKKEAKRQVNAHVQELLLEKLLGRPVTSAELLLHHHLSVRQSHRKMLWPMFKWAWVLCRHAQSVTQCGLILKNVILWMVKTIKG